MTCLPKYLQNLANEYGSLDDDHKFLFISDGYNDFELSIPQLAKMANTYPNKIRRDAIRLGIEIRSKSEAQQLLYSQGGRTHPTEGSVRSQEVRERISNSMAERWEDISEEERERRIEIKKEIWDEKPEYEKQYFLATGNEAIRKASKDGSKLQQFLNTELKKVGYHTEYHRKHIFTNEDLHIDILISRLGIAIEVDGPSHFKPIWGSKALNQSIRSDTQKNGLILGRGMILIRIKQTKSLSANYQREILKQLLELLTTIEHDYPSLGNRYFEIGDTK